MNTVKCMNGMNLLDGPKKLAHCLQSSRFWKVTNERYSLCDLTMANFQIRVFKV